RPRLEQSRARLPRPARARHAAVLLTSGAVAGDLRQDRPPTVEGPYVHRDVDVGVAALELVRVVPGVGDEVRAEQPWAHIDLQRAGNPPPGVRSRRGDLDTRGADGTAVADVDGRTDVLGRHCPGDPQIDTLVAVQALARVGHHEVHGLAQFADRRVVVGGDGEALGRPDRHRHG